MMIVALVGLAIGARADEYHIRVGQFDKVSVVDSLNVVYRCNPDSTGSVGFAADRSMADAIMCSLDKGDLKIRVATEAVGSSRLPTVYIYSDFLLQVSNSGLGTVKVENPAPVPTFKATLTGNGKIEAEGLKATTVQGRIQTGNGLISLEGSCELAKFNMVGAGTIQADNLKADKVECKTMGSGTVGCWAEFSLKIGCIGSTKFYYKGEPAIQKKGGGKLIPID